MWASIGMSETCRNVVVRGLEMSRFRGLRGMSGGGIDSRRTWRERGGGVLAAAEQGGGGVERCRQQSHWRDFQHLSTALRHLPTANTRGKKGHPQPFGRGCFVRNLEAQGPGRAQSRPDRGTVRNAGRGDLAISFNPAAENDSFAAAVPRAPPQRRRWPPGKWFRVRGRRRHHTRRADSSRCEPQKR